MIQHGVQCKAVGDHDCAKFLVVSEVKRSVLP